MRIFSARRHVRLAAAIGAVLLPAGLLFAAGNEGWYTQAQATRGHQLFNNQCAQCHRPDLMGAAGPALVGPEFLAKWGGKPLSELYTFEHTKMPAINPGSVPPDQLWMITAYILQKNGFAAGDAEIGDTAAPRTLTK
jgi:mono/diheme cytochrome c family protein